MLWHHRSAAGNVGHSVNLEIFRLTNAPPARRFLLFRAVVYVAFEQRSDIVVQPHPRLASGSGAKEMTGDVCNGGEERLGLVSAGKKGAEKGCELVLRLPSLNLRGDCRMILLNPLLRLREETAQSIAVRVRPFQSRPIEMGGRIWSRIFIREFGQLHDEKSIANGVIEHGKNRLALLRKSHVRKFQEQLSLVPVELVP